MKDEPKKDEPLWHKLARCELGQSETAGDKDNARIVDYARRVGVRNVSDDETPWCATFLGAILADAGLPPSRSALARSYEAFGTAAGRPPPLGAVCVLSSPGRPAWTGHVGLVTGLTKTHVRLLGGNQGDRVSEAWFPRSRIVALRWPAGVPQSGHAPAPLLNVAALPPTPSDR